jgi:hypothetical protein
MNPIIIVTILYIATTTAQDSTGGISYNCDDFKSYNDCKNGQHKTTECAWCYLSNKCCKWDICGNKTNCDCPAESTKPFTTVTCEEYKKQMKIILIVIPTVFGSFGLMCICCCCWHFNWLKKIKNCCYGDDYNYYVRYT